VVRAILVVGLAGAACARSSPIATLTGSDGEPASFRGESTVSWRVYERGVSWTEHTTYALEIELRLGSADSGTLRVVGTRETTSAFLMDEDREPESSSDLVDHSWRVAVVEDAGDGIELDVLDDGDRVQAYRCRARSYPDKPAPVLVCAPQLAHDGLAWEDPLPAYLRLPLVLTHRGRVHVELAGEQGRATTVDDIDVR
jgi:hypothetical protein